MFILLYGNVNMSRRVLKSYNIYNLQYFECKGDSGRKVHIVGDDNIGHCEEFRINMCMILSG